MSLNVGRELAVLQKMTVAELRRKYEEVFREACRSFHKVWLVKRNADCEPDNPVRLFKTNEAAAEWLLLSTEAAAALHAGDGFVEVARFESTTPAR